MTATKRSVRTSLVLTSLLMGSPVQAWPQIAVSATGVAAHSYGTILFQGYRERLGGIRFGGAFELELGPVALSAFGLRGDLTPIENTQSLDRTSGAIGGRIGISPVSWFTLEGGYTVRAFRSAAGYQEWRIPAIGARLSGKLGHPALRAYVRGAYLPSVQVSGIESPDFGLAAEAGLEIAPTGVPLFFKVYDRLERYDFPGGASSRLEHFDELGVSIGLRFAGK